MRFIITTFNGLDNYYRGTAIENNENEAKEHIVINPIAKLINAKCLYK